MSYSDAEKAEALIRLATNRYDFARTAMETGLPKMTLRRWNKIVPKKGVADLLERAIERLLMSVPENMTGQDWSVSLGILLDKWLLVQGKATSRVENLFGALEKISDDELDRLIDEFTRAANSRVSATGEGPPETG